MPKIWRTLFVVLGVLGTLSSAVAAGQQRVWREPVSGIEMVWIQAGCFQMGADQAGEMRLHEAPKPPLADELPRHEVCLDGFWLGRYPVTRGQWQRIIGSSAVRGLGGAERHPMAEIALEDVQAFLQRLNAAGGSAVRFRLPTEAEWEYACRAGGLSEPDSTAKELKQTAWYRDSIGDELTTRPVGEKAPNAFGLHDMLGNVWEWTGDVYLPDGYAHHALYNPRVTKGSERRVIRGGSYRSAERHVRCGSRNYGVPGDRLPMLGLRVAMEGKPR